MFLEFVKPYFSDKSSAFSKIALFKNDLILRKDEDIALVMNSFFSNVYLVRISLSMKKWLLMSITLYLGLMKKNHPSIRPIKENNKDNYFTFGSISKSDIKKRSQI